jgi:hypothetical protein
MIIFGKNLFSQVSDKSEKYRRIVNVLENTPNGIPKDMLIKCKVLQGFLKKLC